jgi:predicted ester cyclase
MAFDAKKVIVQRFFDEALVRFRGEEMPFLLTPSFRCDAWSQIGVPDGPDGAREHIRRLDRAFSRNRTRVVEMSEEGGCIVVRYVFEADHTGGLAGIAPLGRQVSVPGLLVARFEGCRIAELSQHVDVSAALAQMRGEAAA